MLILSTTALTIIMIMLCLSLEDCHPVEREGKSISVTEGGVMWLSAASEEDAGTYTCLVDLDTCLDGRRYTAARSVQLVIKRGAYHQRLHLNV